ncbi:MAG: class I SAM-dependent methyltransferase [Candidatus Scalindua sp.]|nr:class I SAM-dependent methyltransferase [Candidatus Scalindua sp.]
MSIYKKRSNCRLCGSEDVELVVPLGNSPVSEKYITEADLEEEAVEVPLNLYFCNNCTHVQLLDVVEPEYLWSDYTFKTGNNPKLIEHFDDLSRRIELFTGARKRQLVIDIGSNDGTLLDSFCRLGYTNILGVEPSLEISKLALDSGIRTINRFFDEDVAEEILNQYGKAGIVTANNVFAHIDDLGSIASAIKELLAEEGVFVFEVSYLLDVVGKMLIGTIFHEHLSYHSVLALDPFLRLHGLEIIKVERGPEQGGSIVVYAQLLGGNKNIDNSVYQSISMEKEFNLDKSFTVKKMYERLETVKSDLIDLVSTLKSNGSTIAGFGAARAGTTLLSYFGIGSGLDFLVDDNSDKHYKYSPGDKLQVLPVSEIYNKKPDYIIIFAWLFADQIVGRHNEFISGGGRFITVFPEIKVLQ